MKFYSKILICLLFVLNVVIWGQKGIPFTINLEYQNLPQDYGEFNIVAKIKPIIKCDSAFITINTFGNINVEHQKLWLEYFLANDVESQFKVSIPDNDTTGFELKVQSGKIWHHAFLYFVTTGKGVEVFKGNPRYELKHPNVKMKIKIEGDKGEKLPSELPNFSQNNVPKEPKTIIEKDIKSNSEIDTTFKKTTISKERENTDNIKKEDLNFPLQSKFFFDKNDKNILSKKNNDDSNLSKKIKKASPNKFVYLLDSNILSITSTTIFSDNFGGSYPGNWSIGHDGGGGNYSWAWPNGYAHCYSNPYGGQYFYPNNLHVYMERRNVSLSGYSSAILSFNLIVDTESGYDKFTVNVRDQNGNWHELYVESGESSLSWNSKYLDLSQFAGQTGLYIQFRFDSDGSVSGSPYDGVFIDGVSLTAEQSQPNLSPYSPSWWDYPIVPSSVSGTNSLNTLYAAQTTYIDWAILNNGAGNITTTFYTALFIDGNYITRWSTSSLQSNYWTRVEDYELPFCPTVGYHTLKIVTDYYNDIDESNENDNEYSRQFYWEPNTAPNLIPYSPSGWDYAIVPSSVPGTNTVNTLYADQITYIDWCVKNSGDENAGQFHTALYIDNNFITSWDHSSGLQVNYISKIEDYEPPLSLTEGYHTLKIVADYQNEVTESNENDNEYSRQFYWEGAGTIIVEGWIRYRDLNNDWPNARDMRKVRVELWDDDVTSGDDLLIVGNTDNTGHFSLGPVTNSEPLQGQLDIYIKAFAQNEACIVNESHNGDTYFIQTEVVNNVPNGTYDFGTLITTDEQSGSFYIADRILDGYNKWNTIMQSSNPGTVQLVWNDNVGTHYTPSEQTLYIDAQNDPSNWYPDTFDKSVIVHEYGHRLEDVFDFFDGGGGSHSWSYTDNLDLASSEGWATFWSNITYSTPDYYDRYNNFQDYYYTNSETCEYGDDINNLTNSANNFGNMCEGAVCGMYWDLFDNVDDDYDSDGIGDSYSGSINDILSVLTSRQISEHHPDHSDDFFDAWLDDPAVSTKEQIGEIWFEHGDLNRGFPVEITIFTAFIQNNQIILNWETAIEVNNYGFEIEQRKQDSMNSTWKHIGFVEGHGNSNSPKNYKFVISENIQSGIYEYRLKQINIDGTYEFSNIIEVIIDVPNKFQLSQNFPNPFNPSTKLRYSISENCTVNIRIFNSLGEEIFSFANLERKPGNYELNWDASNLSSGFYIIKLTAFNGIKGTLFTDIKKAMLLK